MLGNHVESTPNKHSLQAQQEQATSIICFLLVYFTRHDVMVNFLE
jgi:hypothetical protein